MKYQKEKVKKIIPFKTSLKNTIPMGLPWGHSGKESSCQYKGHGFDT